MGSEESLYNDYFERRGLDAQGEGKVEVPPGTEGRIGRIGGRR